MLSIKIPQKFFNELNSLFLKFIWSGGKDRVQRKILYSDYIQCGLKMIDPRAFALAQKMTWVKYLLDENYWKAYAPESILRSLENSQVADSLRTWYIYRENATLDRYSAYQNKGNPYSKAHCSKVNRFENLHVAYK